ncbi:MAG: hypothetical protein ACOX17_02150 [Christensenellales bacterium]|jgi:hypothetical protein
MRIDAHTYAHPARGGALCLPSSSGLLCVAAGGGRPEETAQEASAFPGGRPTAEVDWGVLLSAGDILTWAAGKDAGVCRIRQGRFERLNRQSLPEGKEKILPGDRYLAATRGFWQYVGETEAALDACAAIDARDWAERMLLRLAHRCLLRGEPFALTVLTAEKNEQGGQ